MDSHGARRSVEQWFERRAPKELLLLVRSGNSRELHSDQNATVDLMAISDGVAIAYGVGLWLVLIVGPATITALKGQWLLFAAGFLTVGIVWMIAALRLAQPGSWWARRFYGPDKLARSEKRYGTPSPDQG